MKLALAISTALLSIQLAGCIPPDAKGTIESQITVKTQSKTPVGTTLMAEVGDKVYESGQIIKTQSMTATTGVPASGHMYGLHYIDVPRGFTGDLMTRSFDQAQILCVDVSSVSGGVFIPGESYKCLVDANKDKTFESSMYSNHQPYWPLKAKVPYTTASSSAPIDATGSFKYELIYQGYAQGVLRFAYREYVDDMARPAFTQDLTYEHKASVPTVVGFKGLRMRVLDANNTKVTYVIEQGLENKEKSNPKVNYDTTRID